MNKNTLWLIRALSLIALILAAYLAWTTLNKQATLVGCGEGSGCEEVLQTRFSKSFGIPVSFGALAVYGSIFALTFRIAPGQTKGWLPLAFLSVLASLSGLWFVGLQIFKIHAYCKYCTAIHFCGLIITFFVLKNLPIQKEEKPEKSKKKKASQPSGIPASRFVNAGILAVIVVAVLAFGQMNSGSTDQTKLPNGPGEIGTSFPMKTVRMAKGMLPVNVGEYPTLGSMDAKYFVAHLFDYTCPACRKLHPDLIAAHQPNQQNVALTLIPMPLDAECNPGVQQTAFTHLNACTYARIGLAVWRSKPEAYLAYDHFIFSGEYPPGPEQATAFASQLVGQDLLTRALADPHLDEMLRAGISMFYSNALERKVLPILMTPDRIIYGIPDPSELTRLFATHQ
jgi:uncharacterized membrane protein